MEKNFTIGAEVILFAHWPTPVDSPEDWERRKAVDDGHGVVAADLEDVIQVGVKNLLDLSTSIFL